LLANRTTRDAAGNGDAHTSLLFIYGEACAVLLPMERGMIMDGFWCLDYDLIKREDQRRRGLR